MLYTRKTFSYEYPLEESDVVLLGIPWDYSQTGFPTRYGPLFIREAIKNMVGYDPRLKTNIFKKYKFCDLGDVEIVPGNWKLTEERIFDTVKSIIETNPKVLPAVLGGDHLITLGVLNSLKHFHKKITVVDFDAHRDLCPQFLGERHSHFTWASHILHDKFDLVQMGCRSWSEEEAEVLKKHGVKEDVKKTNNPVYITVDLDALEPGVSPEVGTPEPGGMGLEELLNILRQVCRNRVIGFDIVECASSKANTVTANTAANIFKKIIGYIKS